jgi:hypothetical protein
MFEMPVPANDHYWSTADVKYRLADAARTLKQMPLPKGGLPRAGYGSGWPDIVRNAKEAYGYDPARNFRFTPASEKIARMEETIQWLFWVAKEELPLVWGRASGITWRRLEDIDGRSRTTLKTIYDLALATIQTNLNRQSVHNLNTKK